MLRDKRENRAFGPKIVKKYNNKSPKTFAKFDYKA